MLLLSSCRRTKQTNLRLSLRGFFQFRGAVHWLWKMCEFIRNRQHLIVYYIFMVSEKKADKYAQRTWVSSVRPNRVALTLCDIRCAGKKKAKHIHTLLPLANGIMAAFQQHFMRLFMFARICHSIALSLSLCVCVCVCYSFRSWYNNKCTTCVPKLESEQKNHLPPSAIFIINGKARIIIKCGTGTEGNASKRNQIRSKYIAVSVFHIVSNNLNTNWIYTPFLEC